jgi:hypothetical protein
MVDPSARIWVVSTVIPIALKKERYEKVSYSSWPNRIARIRSSLSRYSPFGMDRIAASWRAIASTDDTSLIRTTQASRNGGSHPPTLALHHLALARLMLGDVARAEEVERAKGWIGQLAFPQGPYSQGYAGFIESWLSVEATLFQLRAALDDFELRGEQARAGLVNVLGRVPPGSPASGSGAGQIGRWS